ncbi:MAG: hypothetical protein QOE75_1761 [Solirubrobacterales bacterium]|jgi:hypothetical protein|nr:hypothetical protein [Solirubrobacterales bacterium]
MAVMERPTWTDERLDDLSQRVSGVDRRMEAGFAELRAEIRAQTRTLVQFFGALLAAMLVGFLGVIATVITQG